MRSLLICLIRLYKLILSPLLPISCRFTPTCSEYAIDAVTSRGILKGSLLSLRRVLRCHPWAKSGFDPVPCCHEKRCTHET